jgi:hypothetical protein
MGCSSLRMHTFFSLSRRRLRVRWEPETFSGINLEREAPLDIVDGEQEPSYFNWLAVGVGAREFSSSHASTFRSLVPSVCETDNCLVVDRIMGQCYNDRNNFTVPGIRLS